MDYETDDLLVRVVDGITIVRLRNADITGTQQLHHIQAEIDGLMDRGVTKLMVDFKYVRLVGSAALGLLIRLQKRMRAAGGTLVLSHSENIAELLRISRTAVLFQLAADPREGRKLF